MLMSRRNTHEHAACTTGGSCRASRRVRPPLDADPAIGITWAFEVTSDGLRRHEPADPDELRRIIQTVLTLSPTAAFAHYEIAEALLEKGEFEAALEEIALEPDEEHRVKLTAILHHMLGNRAEHEAAVRELREKWGEQWPSEIAHVYAMMGEADAAFEWLDRAVAQNEDGLDQQHVHAYYDPIRDDPRWQEFLEKTGTTQEQLDAVEFEVRLPR